MFCDNLIYLRKLHRMTQEELAEQIGVSRQALAKWEAGETVPDLEKSNLIARIFEVSLDDLVNYEAKTDTFGLPLPPKGKHMFGVVTLGEKGQIVIPAKARKVFGLSAGDRLVVLGDEASGLALVNADDFLQMAELIRQAERQD